MRRRTLAALFAAALVSPVLHARAADICASRSCHDVRVPLPAGLEVPDPRVRVLLPEGYERSSASYPVVYLLHGVGDTYRSWTENTDLVTFSRAYRVILVMPDAGRGKEAGWYSDWRDGSRQWETFHTKVLIPYIDRRFRTRGAPHRGVIGFSMGGFGAMSYAARHRGLFRAAASFSGALDTMYASPASGAGFETFAEQFGTPSDRVWGDQVANEDEWRAHNPTDRAADLRGPWLYVASGTGTPAGSQGDDTSSPANYPIENVIFQMNLSFTRALDDADVPYERDFYPGGYHGWPYWEQELHEVLPRLLAQIS